MAVVKRIIRRDLTWLVLGLVVLTLGLYSSDTDRARERCQISMADRWDNAQSWRQAHIARLATARQTGSVADYTAAAQYLLTAQRLESRTAPTAAGRAARCQREIHRWPWL